MTITDGIRSATAYGLIPNEAENAPLTPDGVRQRLSKMGNTFLTLSADDIELTLDENINLPPSALNALRRDAAELFESPRPYLPSFSYAPVEGNKKRNKITLTTAQFFSEEGFLEASRHGLMKQVVDIAFLPHTASVEALKTAGGVFLPPVAMDNELDNLTEQLKKARENGIMYALVSNIGQISLAKSLGFKLIGDFRLNVTNSESACIYRNLGVEHLILSPELTLPKARDIGGGLITYGRIPLMVTERCFIGENFGCDKCNKAALTDRKGEKFPMMRLWQHRNIIFNSIPTYMGDRQDELRTHRIESEHFIFSVEPAREILNVLGAISDGTPLSTKVRRVGRR